VRGERVEAMKRHFAMVSWLVGSAVLWAAPAFGHGDSVSTLQVRLEPSATRVTLQLNFRDLGQWVPPGAADYPAAVLAAMRGCKSGLISLSLDDRPMDLMETAVSIANPGIVRIDFTYPAAAAAEALEVRTLRVDRLPVGHHQVLSVEDARRGNEGLLIAQETLGTEQDSLSIDLPTPSQQTGRLRLVATPALAPRSEPPASSRHVLLIAFASVCAIIALIVAFRRMLPSPQRSS
jgi:hypothetical protein